MTTFEFVLPLVSVLVGLALADLAVSVHRLLRARRRVRWDWLPLAAALLAALAVFNLWWGFFSFRAELPYHTLGGFLPFAAQLFILFLLNAAALPDEVPDEGLDLRAFYETNGPLFWLLYAALVVVTTAHVLAGRIAGGMRLELLTLAPNVVLFTLFVVLARVRRRALHGVALVGLLVLFILQWSRMSLGTG